MWHRFLLLTVLFLCSHSVRADNLECRNWLQALDFTITGQQLTDAGSYRIPGYPHLRANRWLAFLRREAFSDEQQTQWLKLASELAFDGFEVELMQLPAQHPLLTTSTSWRNKLHHCLNTLIEFTALPGVPNIEIPDNYSRRNRLLGLYGVAQLVARPSMNDYRQAMNKRFQRPVRLPIRHYMPEPFRGTPPTPDKLTLNPLEIPMPSQGAAQAMLVHYAPVISVANTLAYNQPGTVVINSGIVDVEYTQPAAYSWLTWTRYRGHNLLQLNYQFWFSERPVKRNFDLYAGKLDSIIWRVTLKPDGHVLMYDSIHGCGCYHKVYPVSYGLNSAKEGPAAPVYYPQLAANARDTRISLVLEPDTHYIVRVETFHPGQQMERYTLNSARQLLMLQNGANTRSLYNHDGLIPESKRPERFILWPLGIPSAGTMRQPGTHATAFIGKRHFDSPTLLDELFR